MSEQRQPADAAAPERNPWLILFVLCGAVFMLLLDTTIVNVIVPSIIEDLGINSVQAQWIQESYAIVFAALLLGGGITWRTRRGWRARKEKR